MSSITYETIAFTRDAPSAVLQPAVSAVADGLELTILMPCLNEAETLGRCIEKASGFLARTGVRGEIVVADNGSTDGSQAVAVDCGARLVHVAGRGYGAALQVGIAVARGRFVIMGDSDDSYDFSNLDQFLDRLRHGDDLVMGNRFAGGIAPGAMPPLHRYLGNPVLTGIGRFLFGSDCRDFHCGLRGFRRDAAARLDLRAPGMEFASEMVVKATLARLRVSEVPTTLAPDGRSRAPHLRSWRDGWRHLRFLLLFCPDWLFLYPGLVAALAGGTVAAMLIRSPVVVFGVTFDIDTLLYACVASVLGVQAILFWVFARTFGTEAGLLPRNTHFEKLRVRITFEAGLTIGGALLALGLVLGMVAVGWWGANDFGPLRPHAVMRVIIPSATCILLAFNIGFGCCFLNIMDLQSRRISGVPTVSTADEPAC